MAASDNEVHANAWAPLAGSIPRPHPNKVAISVPCLLSSRQSACGGCQAAVFVVVVVVVAAAAVVNVALGWNQTKAVGANWTKWTMAEERHICLICVTASSQRNVIHTNQPAGSPAAMRQARP